MGDRASDPIAGAPLDIVINTHTTAPKV
jgi:hypothetical protein